VNPHFPHRRKSRAQAKSNRNQRNRRVRRDVLAVINSLLDEVEESLNYPPPSSPHISSPISAERFPSPSRYDPVSPLSSPLPPLSPIHASPLPPVSPLLLPDFSPLSPSASSTSSVEFLAENPAPSPPFQSYDLNEFPFVSIATHFPQSNSPPPPGAYTIGPGAVNLEDLRTVISVAHPDHRIVVYFPEIPLPYLVPANFFFQFFPPSSATLHEL